jgi:hypothetical protein
MHSTKDFSSLLFDPFAADLGSAGVPAPYPPPTGFHWVFVTESGARVTESGAVVVELVAIGIS